MPDLPPRYQPLKGLAALRPPKPSQEHDDRRGSAYARGYDHWWDRQRREHLRRSPLCVCCEANGFIRPATLVDHIVPHRGNKYLFRDPKNWQSLCSDCHNRIKSVVERLWEAGRLAKALLRLDRKMSEYFDLGE